MLSHSEYDYGVQIAIKFLKQVAATLHQGDEHVLGNFAGYVKGQLAELNDQNEYKFTVGPYHFMMVPVAFPGKEYGEAAIWFYQKPMLAEDKPENWRRSPELEWNFRKHKWVFKGYTGQEQVALIVPFVVQMMQYIDNNEPM